MGYSIYDTPWHAQNLTQQNSLRLDRWFSAFNCSNWASEDALGCRKFGAQNGMDIWMESLTPIQYLPTETLCFSIGSFSLEPCCAETGHRRCVSAFVGHVWAWSVVNWIINHPQNHNLSVVLNHPQSWQVYGIGLSTINVNVLESFTRHTKWCRIVSKVGL
jgi:hypothetical protein